MASRDGERLGDMGVPQPRWDKQFFEYMGIEARGDTPWMWLMDDLVDLMVE